jgi:hypothetical protein
VGGGTDGYRVADRGQGVTVTAELSVNREHRLQARRPGPGGRAAGPAGPPPAAQLRAAGATAAMVAEP